MSGITLFAQNDRDSTLIRPLSSFNINLGAASIASVSYDRMVPIGSNFMLTGKLGLGYNKESQLCLFGPCSSPAENYTTITHHVTGILGKKRSFFEIGLGGTIIIGNTDQHYYLYPIVGYRLSPLIPTNLTFRVYGLYPFSGFDIVDILVLPIGLSLGISL
jgi:hypothetical protein